MTEAAANVICRETGHTYAVDWFSISWHYTTLEKLASKMIVLDVHCGHNATSFRECRYKVNQTWDYERGGIRTLLGLICNPSPGF